MENAMDNPQPTIVLAITAGIVLLIVLSCLFFQITASGPSALHLPMTVKYYCMKTITRITPSWVNRRIARKLARTAGHPPVYLVEDIAEPPPIYKRVHKFDASDDELMRLRVELELKRASSTVEDGLDRRILEADIANLESWIQQLERGGRTGAWTQIQTMVQVQISRVA